MRQAQELSWNLAILFTGQRKPKLKRISDIKFIKPIELNSLITMTASVVFTDEKYLIIRVIAEVLKPGEERIMTNEVYFMYLANKKLPEIIPKSYKNAIIYLEAKRHFDKFIYEYKIFKKLGILKSEEE